MLKRNDGFSYTGEFKNDARHGLGEICWPDGCFLICNWENNLIKDKGFFKHINGEQGEIEF